MKLMKTLLNSVIRVVLHIYGAISMLQSGMHVFLEVNDPVFVLISGYEERTQLILHNVRKYLSHFIRVHFAILISVKLVEIMLVLVF